MTPRPQIIFVHEGKAAYPEIAAYRRFFADRFETAESRARDLKEPAHAVLWHMMGVYPRRWGGKTIIHDYRSLSVGRFSRQKDLLKRHLNARPTFRIFQNEAIRGAMGFRDDVPSFLLPMGVPESILALRGGGEEAKAHDFCYIGAMSAERRTDLMIDSFLRRFGASKNFLLLGAPEPWLLEKYRVHSNVLFGGKRPQDEVFALLKQTRCAVNYFPNHFPHLLQTPTKLLEYAALGARVLSNEHPASREAAKLYGIASLWGPEGDMFRDAPDDLSWADNGALDPAPFLWPAIIEKSGIARALAAAS